MELPPDMPLAQIIKNCQEQTANYLRKRASDTKYCYELFSRAIVERNFEALDAIFVTYQGILISRASKHLMLNLTNETAEYFVLEGFRAFQMSMNPEKFKDFPSVSRLVKYILICVDNKIRQYVRDHKPEDLIDPDFEGSYVQAFDQKIEFQKLWEHMCLVLVDEQSILLARLTYIYDMKPKEIVVEYGHIWPTTRDVSTHKQKIHRKLSNDPRLRNWGH